MDANSILAIITGLAGVGVVVVGAMTARNTAQVTGMERVVTALQNTVDGLQDENKRLRDRNEALEKRVAELERENGLLKTGRLSGGKGGW